MCCWLMGQTGCMCCLCVADIHPQVQVLDGVSYELVCSTVQALTSGLLAPHPCLPDWLMANSPCAVVCCSAGSVRTPPPGAAHWSSS
jgi:hypothetical protein